jgi:hypothetical protein
VNATLSWARTHKVIKPPRTAPHKAYTQGPHHHNGPCLQPFLRCLGRRGRRSSSSSSRSLLSRRHVEREATGAGTHPPAATQVTPGAPAGPRSFARPGQGRAAGALARRHRTATRTMGWWLADSRGSEQAGPVQSGCVCEMKLLCDVRKADWRLEITEFSESAFPSPGCPVASRDDQAPARRVASVRATCPATPGAVRQGQSWLRGGPGSPTAALPAVPCGGLSAPEGRACRRARAVVCVCVRCGPTSQRQGRLLGGCAQTRRRQQLLAAAGFQRQRRVWDSLCGRRA